MQAQHSAAMKRNRYAQLQCRVEEEKGREKT